MTAKTAATAVVLVSGGLDSTTLLALARAEGYRCHTLSFDYGQRHRAELAAAARISAVFGAVEHKTVALDLRSIGGSALTDVSIPVPTAGDSAGIPITYVPARNTIFLAIALGWAEVLGARDLFIGVNAVDYSGYPDCRPEFIRAFEVTANLATRAGVEGRGFSIHTPLIDLGKAEIIARGIELGVDYAMTVSCYLADPAGRACGRCDSCRLRAAGFAAAGVADPTAYQD
ncbi:MAG: 7-cyano-7-deazaguanine synthase QueC [Porticoccaceae bacterium]